MKNAVIKPLVLMTGVALLAAGLLFFLDGSQQRGRDSLRISFVSQLNAAIKHYHRDTGSYPVFEDFDQMCQSLKTRGYISTCPMGEGKVYGYAHTRKPLRFQVWAQLETPATALSSDSDINSIGWSGQTSTGQDSSYYYDLGSQ